MSHQKAAKKTIQERHTQEVRTYLDALQKNFWYKKISRRGGKQQANSGMPNDINANQGIALFRSLGVKLPGGDKQVRLVFKGDRPSVQVDLVGYENPHGVRFQVRYLRYGYEEEEELINLVTVDPVNDPEDGTLAALHRALSELFVIHHSVIGYSVSASDWVRKHVSLDSNGRCRFVAEELKLIVPSEEVMDGRMSSIWKHYAKAAGFPGDAGVIRRAIEEIAPKLYHDLKALGI